MSLGFFQRKDRYTFRFVQFGQKMFHKSLEQKDHGKALYSLTMSLERKPGPVRFIPNDNLSLGQKIPGVQRNHAKVDAAVTVPCRNTSRPGEGLRDLPKAGVSCQQPCIEAVENFLNAGFQGGRDLHRLKQPAPEL